jgi:antitoxin VapB
MVMATAKLFWSGRSQAVRLPKEFRFQGNEVHIRRQRDAVILEPVVDDWSWLDAIVGRLDDDFVEAVNQRPEPQQRPALDELFRSRIAAGVNRERCPLT